MGGRGLGRGSGRGQETLEGWLKETAKWKSITNEKICVLNSCIILFKNIFFVLGEVCIDDFLTFLNNYTIIDFKIGVQSFLLVGKLF